MDKQSESMLRKVSVAMLTRRDSAPKYWVSDVCDTLVAENTTRGLLRWHFGRTCKWRAVLLTLLTARYAPPRIASIVLEKLHKKSVVQYLMISLLRGVEYTSLEASAKEYARWLLSHKAVTPVIQQLEKAISERRLILASASLEPVVKALAEQLGARYVASTLEIRNGLITGRYREDITGQKLEVLDRRLGIKWRDGGYFAMSDNLTDRRLLARAARAFVILHNPCHRRLWKELSVEFIEVSS